MITERIHTCSAGPTSGRASKEAAGVGRTEGTYGRLVAGTDLMRAPDLSDPSAVSVHRRAFVAHQRVDAAMVQALSVVLLETPTQWRLNDVIPYVEGWRTLAADAIEEADAFILIATPASLASEPCRYEWQLAAKLGKPIVRLDRSESLTSAVPGELAESPSIVIADPYAVCLPVVTLTLLELLGVR